MSSIPSHSIRWLPLREAASILTLSDEALRKTLERRARPGPDGAIEAELDGVRARKFGRVWRVSFSDRWLPAEDVRRVG